MEFVLFAAAESSTLWFWGATPVDAHGLYLPLSSGIIPRSALELHGTPEIEPGLVVGRQIALPIALSLWLQFWPFPPCSLFKFTPSPGPPSPQPCFITHILYWFEIEF